MYSSKSLLFIILASTLLLNACVGKKKLVAEQNKAKEIKSLYEKALSDLGDCRKQQARLIEDTNEKDKSWQQKAQQCEEEKKALQIKADKLENELNYVRTTNTNLLDRLSDLSVVSKTGAESIKKSLEAINDQNRYIKDLNDSANKKDSINLALVTNLKRSLENINDEDVTVEVKKGVVYVSLSDKMLFKSGSYEINPRADEVLSKIARVVNDHRELDILVEGHTDNVPINTGCMKDNWDLSVMRATAVVRSLQTKYGVQPSRMTAGGRSEYVNKSDNTSADGRRINRRTEIIILPKLDQFFKLSEPRK
jgi:chemotaxis protein MotB